MTRYAFFANTNPVPPFDQDRVALLAGAMADHPLCRDAASCAALTSLASHSPFLARLLERDADTLEAYFLQAPDAAFEALLTQIASAFRQQTTLDGLMRELRRARRHAAVLAAMADHLGHWQVEQVTRALTRFADVAVAGAVDGLLRAAAAKSKIQIADEDHPAAGSGIAVLGMGKYGAGELNYSSDIDLIVFYDPECLGPLTGGEASRFAVKLTKDLVAMLHEATGDGYVFRVDLRLRPDAASTLVAISFDAAEAYYEALGQNWERAAFIKARAVAGDIEAGERFLDTLTPFVWRKYLDYATIEDIHSILRQIHSHGRHTAMEVEGHDVKLGLGGIREIEFFVQTQQLIAGGREPELRGRSTLPMLRALAKYNHIDAATADDMAASYRYLRHVEHRLQMVEDQQTHKVPVRRDDLARVASFVGAASVDEFRKTLLGHLARVHAHARSLFKESSTLGDESGSLVFTGVEDDPDTLATLEAMGFVRTSDIAGAIRKWHHGRLRATRSTRSRARLTELMPRLLRALAETADPDMAFWRFDDFLSGLPTGIQLFSMFNARPELMAVLAEILGTAPRLSRYLSRHAHVIDAFLDPGFLSGLPSREDMIGSFETALESIDDLEESMNVVRRTAREFNFQTGVQLLLGRTNAAEAGARYSWTAEIAIDHLIDAVDADFASNHGRIAGAGFAVVALGRLGSQEMTATSDIDLIFVYDLPEGAGESDGERPLDGTTYYTRFAQRLVNAITSPTEFGKLYEVDMRLRPSGNKGPVATQLKAFRTYHEESAWTWERMALTRARVVYGPDDLRDAVEAIIGEALTRDRDQAMTTTDVRDMRGRLDKEFGRASPWSVKYVRGGLVDVEFIAQGLMLLAAPKRPAVLRTSTAEAIDQLRVASVLHDRDALNLAHAFAIYSQLDAILRLAVEGEFDPTAAPLALRRLLARNLGVPFEDLESALVAQQAFVLDLFERSFPASAPEES